MTGDSRAVVLTSREAAQIFEIAGRDAREYMRMAKKTRSVPAVSHMFAESALDWLEVERKLADAFDFEKKGTHK